MNGSGQIYDDLVAAGLKPEGHESDLYVRDTPKARAIIEQHGQTRSAKPFRGTDGKAWLDLPFQYAPFWRAKARHAPNGHRRGDKHGHELVGDEQGFIVIEEEPDDRHPYILVNPTDYDNWMNTQLFAFQFGAYGWTRLLVWSDSMDAALEEAAGWLADHAPGILTNDEEMAELFNEYREDHPEASDEEAQEGAQVDMTYTESGWIPSWEWHAHEVVSGTPMYEATLQGSMQEYEEQYEEPAPKQRRRR